jgi:hypothetical protein
MWVAHYFWFLIFTAVKRILKKTYDPKQEDDRKKRRSLAIYSLYCAQVAQISFSASTSFAVSLKYFLSSS